MSRDKYTQPFGNSVKKSALRGAFFSNKMFGLIAGKIAGPLDLVAVPKGHVYKHFNVLTLVRRDDIESQKDPETGKLLKYEEITTDNSLIIGTIRMGFGHWRIAIALASAAKVTNTKCYILDLLSFKGSNISSSIDTLEWWYSKLSRLSQTWKWFNEHVWEPFTSKKNAVITSCIQQRELSKRFVGAFQNLPKDIPIVAAHPWVGHAAVLCGMTNVISMIPDNLPLAFWLVEGSKHTVQSPSGYMGYRTLINMEDGVPITNCIPENEIMLSGHYVDYEMLASIKDDNKARRERIKKKAERRFLLTMGGAGAQAQKFAEICCHCRDYVEQGKAAFFINMGDHAGRWEELKKELDKNGIPYIFHDDWKKTQKFIAEANNTRIRGIHIFLHKDFFEAVYTTNLLIPVSDVMITKPSELSFYPIPKLFIQRVGRHEAWGAIRASEIADGTKECENPAVLNRVLSTIIETDDLLNMMLFSIESNVKAGIYDGGFYVVKLAMKELKQYNAK
ncbi:MAG: hypothetical protein MJ169_00730 [Treponema sp.]|nr:hypothetical protein [Treponema sp.]